MNFWIVAIVLSLAVVGLILVALLRRGAGGSERTDLGVYRDQLAAVDRDLARGIVVEEEAERLRTEIKRRVLEADRSERTELTEAPAKMTALAALGTLVVVLGGSALLYAGLGAPGYPDLPLAQRIAAANEAASQRPSQAQAEVEIGAQPIPEPSADFLALMAQLREAVAARPEDREGLRLLAQNEARLGNFEAALAAQLQLVEVAGAEASAADWTSAAQFHLMAKDGTVTPDVRAALDQALALAPEDPAALFLQSLVAAALDGHVPQPVVLAQQGDLVAAHAAQAQMIGLLGNSATALHYAELADLMVLAAGGYVSPEAEEALSRALDLDPQNGTARYYVGLMQSQNGRPDLAFRTWDRLLRGSQPEAPWVPPIRAQIQQVAAAAGVDYQLPTAASMGDGPRGPDADQVEAAEAMSPTERIEMIQNMVEGLADRLATEGGSPAEWAQLIRAYGVLGRRDAAAAIWAEAQEVFPDDINRVPILRAARDAGVEQ